MNRQIPGYQPEKKANPKKKPHPWGVWMPGYLRERSPQLQEKRRGR